MAAADTTAAAALSLNAAKHGEYVEALDRQTESFEYWVTEHIRISGAYWGLSAMFLLGKEGMMDKDGICEHVRSCQHPCGGFGGNIDHDPHMLYTLSAIQILVLYDKLDLIDVEGVVQCMHTHTHAHTPIPLTLNHPTTKQSSKATNSPTGPTAVTSGVKSTTVSRTAPSTA